METLDQAVTFLRSALTDPGKGLPEEVFLLISELIPMVNVDLLIKDAGGRTLLTWRDDPYYEPGWHVPGGVVRFKEKLEDRVRAVARDELGAGVTFDRSPAAINEVIRPPQRTRAHFISLLFRCALTSAPDDTLRHVSGRPKRDQWKWHTVCPQNIISVQEMYRHLIDEPVKP
jgi:ADP-ribose pyrophosphatase YjhB (NUDIX family)